MAARKKKAKNKRVTLKANSALDRLVHDKLDKGFVLRFSTSPTDFDHESPGWKLVSDGFQSNEPFAIAFNVILNSILTHQRVFFVLFKEGFVDLLKHDEATKKACSRRLREKVRKVEYKTFRALMHKSGYFKEQDKLETKDGNTAEIFEVVEPTLRSYLSVKVASPQDQHQEILDFYQRSRDDRDKEAERRRINEQRAEAHKAERQRQAGQ
jgi:hypothetical protein